MSFRTSRGLAFLLALAVASPAFAVDSKYHGKETRETVEHPAIPQDVPGGLVVKFRLGRTGPIVEAKDLNAQFDRVEQTAKLLDREGNPLERRAAVHELSRYKQDRSTWALILSLRDVNPYVREEAAAALGDFGDVRAIRPLIDMLGYSEPCRAEVAGRALEKLTGVHSLGSSLEAWETWYAAYRRWPHGVGTPEAASPRAEAAAPSFAEAPPAPRPSAPKPAPRPKAAKPAGGIRKPAPSTAKPKVSKPVPAKP